MKSVTADNAKKLIDDNLGNENFELIDVRNPDEYECGYIKGSRLIPLNKLFANLNQLDKNKTYLLYCRSGGRSYMAQEIMFENGFLDVINLDGGVIEWLNHGYELDEK